MKQIGQIGKICCRHFCSYSIHLNGACKNPCTCCRSNPIQIHRLDFSYTEMYATNLPWGNILNTDNI